MNKLFYKDCSIALPKAESMSADAWGPIWETWGMNEDYFPERIIDMMPEFKALGIKSITFDAGWYQRDENNGEGIYLPNAAKYAETARRLGIPVPTSNLDAVRVVRAPRRLHP